MLAEAPDTTPRTQDIAMHRILPLTLLAVAISAADYSLPKGWAGFKAGTTESNPVEVDGKPMWRVDQVWPADPTEAANYVPMPWDGKQWAAQENSFGGQPAASTSGGVVSLGIRGPWQDNAASRTCALAFIAPAAGDYTITAKLDVTRWAGDQPVAFHLYRRDPVKKTVRPVQEVPVEVKNDIPLEAKAKLGAGEELLFIAEIGTFHTAGGVAIRELKISGP